MAIERKDLLKFSRLTELAVKSVDDESSESNEVKLLVLEKPITAVGSIPATGPNGEQIQMKMSASEVYVGADNIEDFMKNTEEKDGILLYKGPMHLDVSKPSGRMVNEKFQITKPAKIWLTKVKFSRFGGKSRQDQQANLSTAIATMFGGGTFESAKATTDVTGEGKETVKIVDNKAEKEKVK